MNIRSIIAHTFGVVAVPSGLGAIASVIPTVSRGGTSIDIPAFIILGTVSILCGYTAYKLINEPVKN